ncbi:capsule assembly Wzi family protein [Pseudoalteromonas sp. MMG005]|uniref:capsule assembly Wzi family protein n=1 Tax=Pseudoalteromonas sp. MMG005 TaxID=2822682 RepID=UPI001B3A72EB|nr:capsule assembly Wzi family protein [Pseudoalteromonas sp. MMG005]MBQ4846478.1 hypothetical protein [Pseudoalteromonas sp. MMG005]
MKHLPLTLAVCLFTSTHAIASPWITSDESALKHSLDLLASHGVINRPINQYPLLWQGIVQDLSRVDESTLSPQAHFALQHVQHALQQAKRAQYSSIKAYFDDDPSLNNDFGSRQAAQSGINTYSIITGTNVSAKIQVNYADKAIDEKKINHYGSHLAILYGNWSLSAERLNYWWGPANDNAMMLSNNAAPMKAVRLSRANSDYDGPRFLSFIGPWQVTAIAAKQKPLLSQKHTGDFWGIRLSTTPISGLELAFSSTSSDFIFSGPSNLKDTDKTTTQRRLTSFDFKYSTLIANRALSFYGEVMGDNDKGLAPQNSMHTFGAETFFSNAHYRAKAYIEYSDSTTDCKAQQASFQCNFAEPSQGSDYKERDQWLGAAIGPQAKSITLAADYYQMSGIGAYAKLKHIEFEHIKTKRTLLEVGYQHGLLGGLGKISTSVWQDKDENKNGNDDVNSAVKLSWEFQF